MGFEAAGKKGEGDAGVGAGAESVKVWVPWGDFKATYRGREKEGPGELKTGCVRRVGFMMRRWVIWCCARGEDLADCAVWE